MTEDDLEILCEVPLGVDGGWLRDLLRSYGLAAELRGSPVLGLLGAGVLQPGQNICVPRSQLDRGQRVLRELDTDPRAKQQVICSDCGAERPQTMEECWQCAFGREPLKVHGSVPPPYEPVDMDAVARKQEPVAPAKAPPVPVEGEEVTCPACGQPCPLNFETCWSCQADLPRRASAGDFGKAGESPKGS